MLSTEQKFNCYELMFDLTKQKNEKERKYIHKNLEEYKDNTDINQFLYECIIELDLELGFKHKINK